MRIPRDRAERDIAGWKIAFAFRACVKLIFIHRARVLFAREDLIRGIYLSRGEIKSAPAAGRANLFARLLFALRGNNCNNC